jgi:hypothetical protein
MWTNDNFDLRYSRPTPPLGVVTKAVRFSGSNETDEMLLQREQRYPEEDRQRDEQSKINEILNKKSRQVGEEIHKRLWPLIYLQYLINRISDTRQVKIDFDNLPDIESLSVSGSQDPSSASTKAVDNTPFDKLSINIQMDILEQRQKDARIGMQAAWASLSRLIDLLTSGITEPPSHIDIALRLFTDKSFSHFFEDTRDIRCSNWKQFHIDDTLTRKGAEEHIEGRSKVPSNYISISLSPRRIWNIVFKEDKALYKIAVIDLRVLKRLGIAYASTTDDLHFSPRDDRRGTGTTYATKHHYLVHGWLPPRSILSVLSCTEFERLLKASQINTLTHSRVLIHSTSIGAWSTRGHQFHVHPLHAFVVT